MKMYTVLSIIFLNNLLIIRAMDQAEIRWEDFILSEPVLNQSEVEFGNLQEPALKRPRIEEQTQETKKIERQSSSNELFSYAPFRCIHDNCKFGFNVAAYLILHHKDHGKGIYECDNCSKQFDNDTNTWNEWLTSLKDNVERKNEPPKIEKKHTLTAQSIQYQFSYKPESPNAQAPNADMATARNLLHLQTVRPNDSGIERRRISCDFECGHKALPFYLAKHILNTHFFKGRYHCPHCVNNYRSINKVQEHHAFSHTYCQLCDPIIRGNIKAWQTMRDMIGQLIIEKADHRRIQIGPNFVAQLTLFRRD